MRQIKKLPIIYIFTASSPKKPVVPKLEVVSRVAAIPIVESGIGLSEKIYFRIRVGISKLDFLYVTVKSFIYYIAQILTNIIN